MKDINSTVIVDLKQSEEDLLRKLKKSDRQGINRAKRKGIIVEEVKNDKEWKEFYDIYKKTLIEGGTTPKVLEELKEKTAKLFLCKKESKIIAGLGIWFVDLYDRNIPRLYFNASFKEYLNLQPNNLLVWHSILWGKKEGYDKFDLGGYQIKAKGHLQGINKFKEKWGEIIYYHKEYPFFKAIGRKLIRNSSFLWWLNKKMRGRR